MPKQREKQKLFPGTELLTRPKSMKEHANCKKAPFKVMCRKNPVPWKCPEDLCREHKHQQKRCARQTEGEGDVLSELVTLAQVQIERECLM